MLLLTTAERAGWLQRKVERAEKELQGNATPQGPRSMRKPRRVLHCQGRRSSWRDWWQRHHSLARRLADTTCELPRYLQGHPPLRRTGIRDCFEQARIVAAPPYDTSKRPAPGCS